VPQPSDFINQALAGVLRGAYAKQGMSREQIANATGISVTTIHRYMNGKVDMPSKSFQRIAEAIGRPADELYAEALRDAERHAEDALVSEGEAQNVTRLHPRDLTAEQLDRPTTDRRAATELDAESETDETD
jgi:transcriptional regulator with XRE-family HTH domain